MLNNVGNTVNNELLIYRFVFRVLISVCATLAIRVEREVGYGGRFF